jgi:hypothetical protein
MGVVAIPVGEERYTVSWEHVNTHITHRYALYVRERIITWLLPDKYSDIKSLLHSMYSQCRRIGVYKCAGSVLFVSCGMNRF